MLETFSKSLRILNYSKDSSETDLTELWSDRLLKILIPNVPELHFGQGLLHGDIQRFYYDLYDRYTLNLNIKEDIEFQRGLIVKLLSWKFFQSLRIELYSSVWTFKKIIYDLHNFFRFAHL
jgi:hypothetical protein